MKAILVLEDGRAFTGQGLGVSGEKTGELIFNTAVVGYQEMLTDPANANKILVLTYPLIGNYGCAQKFNESGHVWAAGLVIKEKSRIVSNWQAKESLDDFAQKHNLLAIAGVDTRTLAVHLRHKGEIAGIISTTCLEPKVLLAKLKALRNNNPISLLSKISVSKPTHLGKSKAKKIAILDLGVTKSILRQLETLGLSITLLPYNTPAQEILKNKAKGLIISNGPEDDSDLKEVVQHVKILIGKLPIMGISTGHQVLASALGARLSKMKVGHHGSNYPVYTPTSYKGEISVQNHSWAVDAESLSKIRHLKITSYNLNDRTVEAMESKKLKLLGIQYYPASPGFNEVNAALTKFSKMLGRNR